VRKADEALGSVTTNWPVPEHPRLDAQLDAIVREISNDFGIQVRVRMTDPARALAALASGASTETLVRVAREALVNVAKHSGTRQASLMLDMAGPHSLALTVTDAGRGLDEIHVRLGHGLVSLRRSVEALGGQFQVLAVEPHGAQVSAVVQP
jgi:signal transduction histidine kinase